MKIGYAILALVALQRAGELWYASKNTRALKARGAIEHGRGHYPFIVLLHASWLAAIAIGIHRDAGVRAVPLLFFVLMQALRAWVLATLGSYWTTRVITLPGAPLVRDGPYRFLRHPNYLVVIAEMALLPLAFGQITNAVVFSIVNGAVLAWRIRVEDGALRPTENVREARASG
jgi:methyltransferase